MSTTTPDSEQTEPTEATEATASTPALQISDEVLREAYHAATGYTWDSQAPSDREQYAAFAAGVLQRLLGRTQVAGPPEPTWDARVQAAINSRFSRIVVTDITNDPAYGVLSAYLWEKWTQDIEPTVVLARLSGQHCIWVENSDAPAARIHRCLTVA